MSEGAELLDLPFPFDGSGVSVVFAGGRWKYRQGFDALCATDSVSLDAPEFMAGGVCVNFGPFWLPQMVVRRCES